MRDNQNPWLKGGLMAMLGAVLTACLSTPVAAELTLFSDTFESQPSNQVSSTIYPDTSGVALPVAPAKGTWALRGSVLGNENIQVTDYAAPGAYAGNNYLRMVVGASGQNAYLEAAARFAQQSKLGDHIRLEAEVNLPVAGARMLQILGGDGDPIDSSSTPTTFNVLITNSAGAVSDTSEVYSPNWTHAIPGVRCAAGQWQKWQIDYSIGASTFDIMVGDASGSGVTYSGWPNTSNGQLSWLMFMSYNTGSQVYIDNVKVTNLSQTPEPTSFVMVLTGWATIIVFARWRRRVAPE